MSTCFFHRPTTLAVGFALTLAVSGAAAPKSSAPLAQPPHDIPIDLTGDVMVTRGDRLVIEVPHPRELRTVTLGGLPQGPQVREMPPLPLGTEEGPPVRFEWDTAGVKPNRYVLSLVTVTSGGTPTRTAAVEIIERRLGALQGPADGTLVEKAMPITAVPASDFTPHAVTMHLNGFTVDLKEAPWKADIDPHKLQPGDYTAWADLTDARNFHYATNAIHVKVPERVWFKTPAPGSTLVVKAAGDTVDAAIEAAPDIKPKSVRFFFHDNKEGVLVEKAPFTAKWSVGHSPGGETPLEAEVTDTNGEVWLTRTVDIFVDNSALRPKTTAKNTNGNRNTNRNTTNRNTSNRNTSRNRNTSNRRRGF